MASRVNWLFGKVADGYDRLVGLLGHAGGRFAYPIVLVIIGILLFETVMRYGFNRPPVWATEMSAYLFGTYFLLSGAYLLRLDEHVRMDAIYSRWSPRTKAIVNCVTRVIVAPYLLMLTSYAFKDAVRSVNVGEHTGSLWAPPTAPVKAMVALAATLLLLELVASFIRNMRRAFRETA